MGSDDKHHDGPHHDQVHSSGGHNDHAHHHDNHDHGHGHGGYENLRRNDYPVQKPPFHAIPRPQIGSEEYINEIPAFDNTKPVPPPRTAIQTFRDILRRGVGLNEGDELNPGRSTNWRALEYGSLFDQLTRPMYALRPASYVDPYLRPNPCPEKLHQLDHKWANIKTVNPKIPPPVDGKYNDYYHYLAFKHWFSREKDVYLLHNFLVGRAAVMCAAREGKINAPKNCMHLMNKYWAMRRYEEQTKSYLYMATTGNCIIRETPYPEDFEEQKVKIYDDWLYRTRLRKPGDVA
jgi:hypothetical protein